MLEKLKILEEHGWVYSQTHPTLNLSIWNYTNKTQYENYWTDITLSARGLVLNNTTGEVVSKGFDKFFNFSENKTELPDDINNVTIYEKLDGSYIGLFYYDDRWIINSRGSFNSDQSKMAEDIIEKKDLSFLDKNLTYCFELIHPDNRICVDYGDKKDLIYLSSFDVNGKEYNNHKLMLNNGFSVVERSKITNFVYEQWKNKNIKNKEGYVVKFSNNSRCKIKFDEYIKLHSLYTKTSTRDIWKCLREGDDITSILDDCPDEIYDWIKKVSEKLEKEFRILLMKILVKYNKTVLDLGVCDDKSFAIAIKDSKYKHYMFCLRKGKDIKDMIWRRLEPEYKTFTKDEYQDN